MRLSDLLSTIALAMLQGAIVALPRPDALNVVRRLRSSAWAAVLPGAILVGTFGVLAFPPMAYGLVAVAAVATPVLAVLALLCVLRTGWFGLALLPIGVVGLATGGTGVIAATFASLVTSLGCLFVGVTLGRLIPGRAIPVGILAMCAVDVGLMTAGVGQASWIALGQAASHFHGLVLDRASIGSVSTDYPDLVLAGMIGLMLSRQAGLQRRAASLVAMLAIANGILALLFARALPATVPIVLAPLVLRRDIPQLVCLRLRRALGRSRALAVADAAAA